MTARGLDLVSLVLDASRSCEMPWPGRSFPWPGVSLSRYLTGFLDISFKEGSLTERKRLDAVGTEGGSSTVVRVDVCEVWVAWNFLERGDVLASSFKI